MNQVYEYIEAEDYHWKNNIDKTSLDHLYLLFYDNTVKIGRTKNIKSRIKQLKTGFSKEFKYYVFENKGFLEKTLHNCFSEFRLNGEWFEKCSRIERFLNQYHKEKTFNIEEYLEYNKLFINSWTIHRGKHKGKNIDTIANNDFKYLTFILSWVGDVEFLKTEDKEFFARLGKIKIPEPILIYIKSLLRA